jgi:hypothetical protein
MVLRRVEQRCWVVEPRPGESWEPHYCCQEDARAAAARQLIDALPVPRAVEREQDCWQVVCADCGGAVEAGTKTGPGRHYPLDYARELHRLLTGLLAGPDGSVVCAGCAAGDAGGSCGGSGGDRSPLVSDEGSRAEGAG